MIKVACFECKNPFYKYPSRIKEGQKNLCSKKCQIVFSSRHLSRVGKKYRLKKGHRLNPPEFYERLKIIIGNENNYAWKGTEVSYRGLHQWVRRKKGHGKKCAKCGFESHKPRMIQWANKDGKYHRNLDDYLPLCASCHKIHDRALRGLSWKGFRRKSTLGGRSATQ